MSNSLDLAQSLLDLARRSGAQEAEVYLSQSFARPVSFEANRLKQLEISESEGTALRLWLEGRPGLAVAYGNFAPEILVEKAIALSHLNGQEIIELAEPQTLILPEMGQEVGAEELVTMGQEAIAEIRDRYPEVLCSAELQCERETTLLLTSKGLHCQYTDITLSASLGVEWVRGEDFLEVYEDWEQRDRLHLKPLLQTIHQRLEWAKKNTQSPGGNLPVLLTPNAATLLWEIVADATSGKRVLEGSTPWSQRQGDLVMSKLITLTQEPEQGPYSCPFDDEGSLTQTFTLVDRGILKQFYSDRTAGRALKTGTTGNGFRPSLGGYPTPDLVNLLVTPQGGNLEDLMSQVQEGILVDRVLGNGPDISGDFSVNIDLGYRLKNGQIAGRIKDTMVAGNVYQALQQVIALGEDNLWQGSCYTPSLLVEGLSIIGEQ